LFSKSIGSGRRGALSVGSSIIGGASAALAHDDFLRGFKEGLVVGVFPVLDCFTVVWVVCVGFIGVSIRDASVFGSEKVVGILLCLKQQKYGY
jgi:hypothetical protein